MNKVVIAAVIILLYIPAFAQYVSGVTTPDASVETVEDSVWQLAQSITAAELKEHLYTLASDSFGGRELGSEGNIKAADYISAELKKMGIQPVTEGQYFQDVAFTWLSWKDSEMRVNGQKYKQLWDLLAYPDKNRGCEIQADEVVFLGYGIDDDKYSDYGKVDVKNKVILIYGGEPHNTEGLSIVTESETPSMWVDSLELKLEAAAKHGVAHVLIVENDLKKIINENRTKLLGPKVILGDVEKNSLAPVDFTLISTTLAKSIIGDKINRVIKSRKCIEEKSKSKPVVIKSDLRILQTPRVRSIEGVNVAGIAPGTDLKDEYILVSAHFDHIGMRGKDINNGADDNASGTSTVLELAEAFKLARDMGMQQRRSVVFLLVTGEEKGLLGSQFYVENPLVPLKQSVVDINIDMVGRLHKKYLDNPNYIYVIGSDRLSSQLHVINENVNQRYAQLTLDYTYNAESDPNRFYYRSDHYNFAEKGIPAIFFFNGTHEDYHRPTDTAEKIDYDKMSSVARHIFTLAWDLSNRDNRIQVDVNP